MAAYVFLMLMGATICFIMIRSRSKKKHLYKYGQRTEAIVINIKVSDLKNDKSKYPVVQFSTATQETITATSTEGFFSSPIKKGKKVIVMYNKENPNDFMIQLPKEKMTFITVVVAGSLFFLTGFLLLLNQLDIIHLLNKK